MNYPLVIFFGIAPSFIWLLFYLRKDKHPEPNRMILKVFALGMIITILAATVELGLFDTIFKMARNFGVSEGVIFFLSNFIGIALVEEFFKYFVVKKAVLGNKEFDEPVDVMLYMIVSALGFAALENIFVLLPIHNFLPQDAGGASILSASAVRFVYATFLHALSSATFGYFLAMSFFKPKNQAYLIIAGLMLATILHGAYNISIIKSEELPNMLYLPAVFLIAFAVFVSVCFKHLKKTASVCKIR